MAIQTCDVSFVSTGHLLSGYYACPAGTGPFPGVVVIHEIFGLNDNIRDIARRFADEGYAALAVDLFAGRNRAVCMARFMAANLFGPPGARRRQGSQSGAHLPHRAAWS